MFLNLCFNILPGDSFSVTTTESAQIALAVLRARNSCYDAVVADRQMPEMDIYEFVHEVRRQQMNIPIMCKTSINLMYIRLIRSPLYFSLYIYGVTIIGVIYLYAVIDENQTEESLREAIVQHKVCFVFSKPLSHRDVTTFWQHILRVTLLTQSSDASNSKTRITWTPELHEKFLKALHTLGDDGI